MNYSLCSEPDSSPAQAAEQGPLVNSQTNAESIGDENSDLLTDVNHPSPPIDQLPSEIICDIMDWVLGPSGFPFRIHPNSHVLLAVCKKWREIGISTPHFWSYIEVNKWSEDTFEAKYALFKLRIHRASGCREMDIVLYDSRIDERVWALLVSKLDSWKSLELWSNISGCAEILEAASKAVSLKTLTTNYSSYAPNEHLITNHAELPALRELWLDWPGAITHIRAPLLETLGVHFPSSTSERKHLEEEFQQVKRLHLYRPESAIGSLASESWSMPSVTHLTISTKSVSMTHGLRLPRLNHLTLLESVSEPYSEEEHDCLPESIANSVKTVAFKKFFSWNPVRLLRQLQNVERIVVELSYPERFLIPLSHADDEIICNRLESLAIFRCLASTPALLDELKEFAKVRCSEEAGKPNNVFPPCRLTVQKCETPGFSIYPNVENADYEAIMNLNWRSRAEITSMPI